MEEKVADTRDWPEHLLQMIFCRIPFPYLLKVQGISKTWKARFLDARQSGSPEGKSFQADVLSASSRWPKYCPVFGKNGEFWAYNQRSHKWQKILICPSFRYPKGFTIRFSILSGPFMCLVGQFYDELNLAVFVVNMLSGNHKRLPILTVADTDTQFKLLSFKQPYYMGIDFPLTGIQEQSYPYDIVFRTEYDGYKVYLLFGFICSGGRGQDLRGILSYVYDSRLGSWERLWTGGHRRLLGATNMNTGSSAYLNGNLYCMCLDPAHVWKYCVDGHDGLWTAFIQSEELRVGKLSAWGVVACGDKIMVATLPKMESNQLAVARIYQLDAETLEYREVASIAVPSTRMYLRIISDAEFIYFCPAYALASERNISFSEYSMLVYSVRDKNWSDLLLPEVSTCPSDNNFLVPGVFEPGLLPFALA